MLDDQAFKAVTRSTPLISIDLLVKKDNKILLGKRINKPAQGYLFSISGRIYKNETIDSTMMRIAKNELNIELKLMPRFRGLFEHFMMTIFIRMYQHTMLIWLTRLKYRKHVIYQPNSKMNFNGLPLTSY